MKLVRWCVKEENGIKVTNKRVAELINVPMKICSGESITEIPKDQILCDGCNEPDPEWVMVDNGYLSRCVCEGCRKRYFSKIKTGDDI